jgi:hypothetical protein
MKDCGINNIDTERRLLEKKINSIISEFTCSNSVGLRSKASIAKKDLSDFRMKLAYNRATEALESNFGWTTEFARLNQQLDSIINTKH